LGIRSLGSGRSWSVAWMRGPRSVGWSGRSDAQSTSWGKSLACVYFFVWEPSPCYPPFDSSPRNSVLSPLPATTENGSRMRERGVETWGST
jgi:hypothetical protein